jgi:hypothetical protein
MQREQSWLSRHARLHRLFNAAVIVFLGVMVWNGVLLALHAL